MAYICDHAHVLFKNPNIDYHLSLLSAIVEHTQKAGHFHTFTVKRIALTSPQGWIKSNLKPTVPNYKVQGRRNNVLSFHLPPCL